MLNEIKDKLLDMYIITETIPTWLAWVCKGCVFISAFTIGFLLFKAVMTYVV